MAATMARVIPGLLARTILIATTKDKSGALEIPGDLASKIVEIASSSRQKTATAVAAAVNAFQNARLVTTIVPATLGTTAPAVA